MTLQGEKQLEYTLATHAVEQLVPSEEALRLCEQMADGAVTADAAVSSVLERYGLVRGGRNG